MCQKGRLTFTGRRQTRSEDLKHGVSYARLVPVCYFREPEPEAPFHLRHEKSKRLVPPFLLIACLLRRA